MSIIYKIYCKNENIKDCYIGSTNNLTKRKTGHKSSCNNPSRKVYNSKIYTFIRANGGFENFDFMILEQFENKMIKQDLLIKEREYIEKFKTSLNTEIPSRTQNEYIENTKDHRKQYYINNIENVKKKQKIYRDKNKEKLAEKHKNYYEKNKSELLEKKKETVECEFCKCLVNKNGLKRHQRSNKCLKSQTITSNP